MSKRIIALLLCALMIVPMFAGCSKGIEHEDDKGPYITMYLSDDIYDFDPINAFYNADTQNVVSMMFDTLFRLNENGKIEKSLVKKYTTDYNEVTGEYTMEITLRDAYWSNSSPIKADDIVFAWKRLLRSDSTNTAASLLYDIKNARSVKEGGAENVYLDELGLDVIATDKLLITFEGKPDYDQFLMNLTSVATAPLPESIVTKTADWAKKSSTIVTSGPYKLGKVTYVDTPETEMDINGTTNKGAPISKPAKNKTQKIETFCLERNAYYNRDPEVDAIDKAVTNYRLLFDCTKTDEQLLEDFKNGRLFYMGSIPLSIRNDSYVKENVKVSNSLSTAVCYLNQNAIISNGSEQYKLFADSNVRKALSLVIDRNALAEKVVYAQPATGLVAPGIFNTEKGTDFRMNGGSLVIKEPQLLQAKMHLMNAGIIDEKGKNHASDYSFTIKVASYNDVHIAMAEMLAEAWGPNGLGFDVTVDLINPIVNNDYYKDFDMIPEDVCDDLLVEDIQTGDYEILIADTVAYNASAFSVLANYATTFSGTKANTDEFSAITPNHTGYYNERYDLLIDAAYYVPYIASLTENDWNFLNRYDSPEEFAALYNKLMDIYKEYGITVSKNPDDWAAQRAILLHEAEEVLMEDLPVIPLVFNQDAVLVSEEITKTSTTSYYRPYDFVKSNIKNYERFEYTEEKKDVTGKPMVDAKGKPVLAYKTIFDNFPEIDWDRASKK